MTVTGAVELLEAAKAEDTVSGGQVGLLTRQVRHVARHRSAVPAAFAEKITLAAHQKAADYTLAKRSSTSSI